MYWFYYPYGDITYNTRYTHAHTLCCYDDKL